VIRELQPYQESVVDEMIDLNDKCLRLEAFMLTDSYKKLDRAEQDRLSSQSLFMMGYLDCLQRRDAALR
jgi:hypothetical protein